MATQGAKRSTPSKRALKTELGNTVRWLVLFCLTCSMTSSRRYDFIGAARIVCVIRGYHVLHIYAKYSFKAILSKNFEI